MKPQANIRPNQRPGARAMNPLIAQTTLAAICLALAGAGIAQEPTTPEPAALEPAEAEVIAAPPADAPDTHSDPAGSAPDSQAAAEETDAPLPPMRFETPDAAAMALIEAAGSEEPGALFAVLGSDVDLLISGDPVADAADRARFVELAGQGAHLEDEGEDGAILVLGPEDWPFPIPLVKDESGWYFDTEAGVEELLDRRVGRNELYALAAARAYVEAQLEYAAADPDGNGSPDYAQRFLSREGGRDGLYWPGGEGIPESPLGPLLADAEDEGYDLAAGSDSSGPRPFHGYYFKILTGQGPDAPGGVRSYLEDGRLAGGFGLVAWPASYGNSGVMTLQVDRRGMVYEADLGEDTAAIASAMTDYNPGEGWEPAAD